MEKGSARLFQQDANPLECGWNIVELETRKQVRQMVNELLRLTNDVTVTSNDIQEQLLRGVATFCQPFAIQLVRALLRDDYAERQSVIWLLTLLNDPQTVLPLQEISKNMHLPRMIRLSAALALAGMGRTLESPGVKQRMHFYVMS